MQNIDFYEGKNQNNFQPQFDRQDPEYFSRISGTQTKDSEKNRKRASRIIFLIGALCIITFTTGLAIGIKFAGGSDREIVDKQTYNAVKGIKNKVSNLIKPGENETGSNKKIFPKHEYPFVIKVGNQYTKDQSRDIARFLSDKGHTVILSQKNNKYKIYTGPYKKPKEAKDSIAAIAGYRKYSIGNKVKIIKRI
ncbi:MAG: hypothetical protein GY754_31875 [bacterium]|nr:hypothetical protein [bacterium]